MTLTVTMTRKVIVLKEETSSQLDPLHVTEYRLKWNIPNFISHKNRLASSAFADPGKKLEWKLFVDPGRKESVYVYVNRVGSIGGTSHRLDVSILASDGSTLLTKERSWEETWITYDDFIGYGLTLVKRETLLDETKNLLCEGRLTLFFKFSVTTSMKNGTEGKKTRICKIPESHLTEDLERLFERQIGPDVKLCTDDTEICAHKAILMARSSVFAAMFQNEMEEKITDRVKITDLSSEVLREMLRFMYTGKNPQKDKVTAELLMAADKYDLARLKVMCEDALSSNISMCTAAEMFRVADKYNAGQLKTAAIDFIKKHCLDVISTEGWRDLVEHQPQLLAQVVKAMAV